MRLLISWIAFNNDFTGNKVDQSKSPNYAMHRYFYHYDKHLLLSASASDDNRMARMLNQLNIDFPDHIVEPVYMNISDVIGLAEIKDKTEALLMKHTQDEIDIFFSPGTSIMQLSWFICHQSLGLKSRLLQMRPASKSKSQKPEIVEVTVGHSPVPITSILKEQNIEQKDAGKDKYKGHLITKSLEPVFAQANKIAQADRVTTLISGESGTGKEMIANYIHKESIRQKEPFVTINCSAFNDNLLESRLFGYKKGAFTGAGKDTPGLFELADYGTIFLDEIGDISPYMQQSLLRVLQEKEIQPIGGTAQKIDVRIIAATNQELIQKCQEGSFRWDLYYRLAVVEIELPPLLNRGPAEIRQMIHHFNKLKKKELKKPRLLQFDQEAMQQLINYPYPGNVRELENLIENFYVFCEAKVTINDLPARMNIVPEEKSLHWKDAEKAHIRKVLALKGNNQRQAWLALGYGSLNTFKKKLEEYGLKVDQL